MRKQIGNAYKNFITQDFNINIKNCIYVAMDCKNIVVYVGKTTSTMKNRLTWQYGARNRDDYKLQKYIKLHGWNSLYWTVVFAMKNQYKLNQNELKELDDLEQYYIKLYGTYETEHGLNISSGGGGGNGCHRSEDTKKKLSEITKKQIANTNLKELSGNAHRGENNWCSKLNGELVENIKLEYIDGSPNIHLSHKYNAHRATVTDITRLRTWKHIRPDLNDKIVEINKKEVHNRVRKDS